MNGKDAPPQLRAFLAGVLQLEATDTLVIAKACSTPRGRFKKGVLALVTEPGGITNRLGLAKPIYFLTTRGQHYVLAEFYKRLNKTTWRESQTQVFLASVSQLWMEATCRREGQDLRVGIPKYFFE